MTSSFDSSFESNKWNILKSKFHIWIKFAKFILFASRGRRQYLNVRYWIEFIRSISRGSRIG